MTVFDIVKSFGLTIRAGKNHLDEEVTGGYASDLLSDVIAHSRKGKHLGNHPNPSQYCCCGYHERAGRDYFDGRKRA